MPYKLLHNNLDLDLHSRLFEIRHIQDSISDFLNPSYHKYWWDPSKLHDIDKAVDRIAQAIAQQEKIMIFGDYDVDGIMSSFVLYTFFRKYIGYHNISIQLPHRQRDGYGIKSYHLDEIQELGCTLVITVDNGITAVEEAKHAQDIWLDLIVTDHHHALDTLPDALALVNPQISPDCKFPEICGATVAWKLALHLADKLNIDKKLKKAYHHEMLPFVGIATVADCMPLVDENRLIVKESLEMMNQQRTQLTSSLQGFLDYLNIQEVDSYHIGFMISPRLNASGRMWSAHDGLACLLCSDPIKQHGLLENLDRINSERKDTQEDMISTAIEIADTSKHIIIAASEKFAAGIVGIVAGRLTEKHYKPSVILEIDVDKGIATGSLRGPEYFNIVEMLQDADDILMRYGGHEQAGGLTVSLDQLDAMRERFEQYCLRTIGEQIPTKVTTIDTLLAEHELDSGLYESLKMFGPYGIGNPQPNFLIEDVIIDRVDTIGKKERTHLKLHCSKWMTKFHIMRRGQGNDGYDGPLHTPVSVVGTIKKDDWNGGWYMDGQVVSEEIKK